MYFENTKYRISVVFYFIVYLCICLACEFVCENVCVRVFEKKNKPLNSDDPI